jgi:pyruvate dehydrogenase E1 component alpha subunit
MKKAIKNNNLLKNLFSSKRNFSSQIKIKLAPVYGSSELDTSSFPTETTTTPEELLEYYKTMTLYRRVEYAADDLYKQKQIRGFCHLYIGQEAVALGMHEGSTYEDCLITAYREHCQALSRGNNVHELLAEMMGKFTGSTNGKGGSMHFYNKKNNFYGGHGIVGAQIPMGTGLAFALKYKKKQNACFTMYGDGSTNQGQLLEASNMAGIMKLPVVYVIENNGYAMGTEISRHSHHQEIYSKFRSFPGVKIDGQCIFTVREWTKYCKDFAIKNGPLFFELDTYRYQGHSVSDPGVSYRTKDEIIEFRNTRDCINKVRHIILENSIATEKELKNMDSEIRDHIETTIEDCIKAPIPDTKELFTEVYVKQQDMFIRNTELENSHNFNLLENNNKI